MKFGNLVSYTGKYLSTAKGKATGGNLVFAKITGSTALATDHADYDQDGYYIFAGGAEGHLVDLDTFKSLKGEVKALQDKVGDLVVGDVTYKTVAEYVAAYLASKTTTTVAAADTASDNLLPTEKAVRAAIDSAVSNLGTVMEFKGVVDALPAADGYKAGDVIIYNGEEYVLGTDKVWHEIGQVKEDESVISLAGKTGEITIGTGLVMGDDKKLDVKLAADQGNVTLDITDGLKADVAATDIAYEGEKLDGDDKAATTTATNVKDALDDLFRSDRTTAESLVDLNTRLTGAEGDIADLKAGLEAVEHTTLSDGDATDFVHIDGTTEGSHTNYAISADVVKGANGGDNGLATDAYVKETVDAALAWEVLTDPAE